MAGPVTKGQLICKQIGTHTFAQKTNGRICLFAFLLFTANKTNLSIRFLGESMAGQSALRFNLTFSSQKKKVIILNDQSTLSAKDGGTGMALMPLAYSIIVEKGIDFPKLLRWIHYIIQLLVKFVDKNCLHQASMSTKLTAQVLG